MTNHEDSIREFIVAEDARVAAVAKLEKLAELQIDIAREELEILGLNNEPYQCYYDQLDFSCVNKPYNTASDMKPVISVRMIECARSHGDPHERVVNLFTLSPELAAGDETAFRVKFREKYASKVDEETLKRRRYIQHLENEPARMNALGGK